MLDDTHIGAPADNYILSQSPLQVSLVTSTGFTTLELIATADNPKSTGSTGFQIAGQDLHPCIWFECDDAISTTELANQLDDLFNVYYRITYSVKGRRIVVIPTDRLLSPDELAVQAVRVRAELKTLPNVLVCRPDVPLPARGATTSGVVGNYLLVPATVEPTKPNGQDSSHANTSLEQAVQDDLAKRDLKVGDYGLRVITANEMHKLGFPAVAHCIGGIAIPYPSGKIGNVRLLGPNVSAKFKYCFPSGPRSEVYILGQGALCIITEGEFKAMAIHKACLREGIEAKVIGLNGVWGWTGKKLGKVLAPYFEDALAGVTHVVTVFDYDGTDQVAAKFQGKPKYLVEMAEGQLCAALLATMTEVQFVRIALLAKVPRDKKYAIDDWLLIGTMRQVLGAATPFKVQWFDEAMLYALRRYGQWGGDILDLKGRDQQLSTLQYAPAVRVWGGPLIRPLRPKPDEPTEDPPEDAQGDPPGKEGKPLNPIVFLNTDPRVVNVHKFDYMVDKPYGYVNNAGEFNLWQGWPAGIAGDAGPWTRLVDRVLRHRPDEKAFFHNWVAWLIQNPGGKVFTYLALVSPEQGVGKSLLAESVMAMFGPHGGLLGGAQVFGQFNAQLQGKSLVVVNELATDKAAHVNAFKGLVSDPTIPINEKFMRAFRVRNIANFIITSNSGSPLLVDKENRRDVIIKLASNTAAERAELAAIGADFVKWRDSGGGMAIMRQFYAEYNITNFQPQGRAPHFKGFLDAVEASKSNNQQYVDVVDDFIETCGLPVVLLSRDMIMALTDCDDKDVHQIQRLLTSHHKFIEKRKVMGPNRRPMWTRILGEVPENPNYNMLYKATLEAVTGYSGAGT